MTRNFNRLIALFPELEGYEAHLDKAGDIHLDSRMIDAGDIFIAIQGQTRHGIDFAAAAVSKGATLILSDGLAPTCSDAPVVVIPDLKSRLPDLLKIVYPERPQTLVAVTGTNGKTSTVHFLQQLWRYAGLGAASLGTMGLKINDRAPESDLLTSPDIASLYRYLNKAAQAGVTHLALEASSHGLDQGRLDGLSFAAVAFSNLTQDHLDYHGTMDAYFAAKRKLFEMPFVCQAVCIINRYDPWGEKLARTLPESNKRIDIGDQGFIRCVESIADNYGQKLRLNIDGQSYDVKLPLIGDFQVDNALLALGAALNTGLSYKQGLEALARLKGVKGRLELGVTLRSGGRIYIDFAHTPDALTRALKTIRPYCTGQLFVLFGAGGNRDSGKRRLMGEAAAQYADQIYITDDNPRYEEPALIRRAIKEGAPKAIEIGDRHEAIKAALSQLGTHDILLVAGKGHERGQIIGDKVIPFDDGMVVREAAKTLNLI